MRTTLAVITLGLVMLFGATIGVAQVGTERPGAGKMQEQMQDARAKLLVVTIQDLDLTDEQEARIAAIRSEFRPKIQEGAKQLKTLVSEEVNKIRDDLTPEQRPKVRAIIEERMESKKEGLAETIASLKELDLTEAELAKIAEIKNEFRPKMDEAVKQLSGVLTDAQKQARAEAINAGKSRREVLQAISLTSAQKDEFENLGKQLKDLVGNEVAKVQGVLTAEQKETLQDLRTERKDQVRDRVAHQIANLRDLNLTDQQKESLMKIRQDFRPKIQEAGDQLRTLVGEEVAKVVDVLKPAGVVAERPERVR